MNQTSIIAFALAAIALGSAAPAASLSGVIGFTSGPGGGVILHDAVGLVTDVDVATRVQSWLLPQVDARDGSFISVTIGASVSMPSTWIFNPSTPLNPLWSIAGPDNFVFHLATASIVFQQFDTLLVSGTGTLTSTNFDPTPAIWRFTTQGEPSDGKFSWSSTTTAIPEPGAPALLSATLLAACLLRRRNPAHSSPQNNEYENYISPRDVPACLDGADFGDPS